MTLRYFLNSILNVYYDYDFICIIENVIDTGEYPTTITKNDKKLIKKIIDTYNLYNKKEN